MSKKIKAMEVGAVEDAGAPVEAVLTEEERAALVEVLAVYGERMDLLRAPMQLATSDAEQLRDTLDVSHLGEAKRERVRELLARWMEFGDVGEGRAHPRWLTVQVRALCGMSASEAARGAGVSEHTLSSIERARNLPDVLTLHALWEYYAGRDGMGWLHMEHFLSSSCAELRAMHHAWSLEHGEPVEAGTPAPRA